MRRFLAAGDLHLRKNKPTLRKDDFENALWSKLEQIADIAKENECDAVFFPGDIFDHHSAPYALVEKAVRFFNTELSTFDIYFIFGQHDQRYHSSDKQNTPLGVLLAACSHCYCLTPEWNHRYACPENICLAGASWGEELPQEDPNLHGESINIAMLHKSISLTPLPWDGCWTAEQLLSACPADIFICGDNHDQFIYERDGRLVINMGSVMRTSIAQKEHIPKVALITIDKNVIDVDEYPLMARRDIFDLEKVEAKNEHDEKVAAFVATFGKDFDPQMTFVENLRQASEEAPTGIKQIIKQVMEN